MTAVSMNSGSSASTAVVWMRARGRRPRSAALSALAISRAAAPSVICDDVPAVTDHSICGNRLSMASSTNAGRSAARPSRVVARRPSSAPDQGDASRPRPRPATGMISLPKTPQSVAPLASSWERRPNSSSSPRRDAPLGGDELGGHALVHQALGVALPQVAAGHGRPRRPRASPWAPGSSTRRRRRWRGRRRRTARPGRRRRSPAARTRTGDRRWWPAPARGTRRPARARRPMLKACSPTWLTVPTTTSSSWFGVERVALDQRPQRRRPGGRSGGPRRGRRTPSPSSAGCGRHR